MTTITPNYIEMKATDLQVSKAFYENALDFAFTDYGPEYATVEGGPVDIGLAAGDQPVAPMPAFQTDDLEASLSRVQDAGGVIIQEIFAFPGGRRFEAEDPSGNRFAIYQPD